MLLYNAIIYLVERCAFFPALKQMKKPAVTAATGGKKVK
jgi:hypothetical protein